MISLFRECRRHTDGAAPAERKEAHGLDFFRRAAAASSVWHSPCRCGRAIAPEGERALAGPTTPGLRCSRGSPARAHAVLAPFPSAPHAMRYRARAARPQRRWERLKQRLDRSAMSGEWNAAVGAHRYTRAPPAQLPPGHAGAGPVARALRPDRTCSFPANAAGDLCVGPAAARIGTHSDANA